VRARPRGPEERRDLPEAREGEAGRGRGVLVDKILPKIMQDKRLNMDPKDMPFDMKRMSYGGFKILVDL
jgi:hypothetical protein